MGLNIIENNKVEEKIAKSKAIELKQNILQIPSITTIAGLKYIQHYLFDEISGYKDLDIAVENFAFALVRNFNIELKKIIAMQCNTIDEILQKFLKISLLQPFCIGNKISLRIWLDFNLELKFNQVINWKNISESEYLKAMEEAKNSDKKFIKLLTSNLIKDTSINTFLNNFDKYLITAK